MESFRDLLFIFDFIFSTLSKNRALRFGSDSNAKFAEEENWGASAAAPQNVRFRDVAKFALVCINAYKFDFLIYDSALKKIISKSL